ncbi:helix-turn-helix domain-containing protein [Sphingobium limneticum]|uniref:Helix-turn-helix domain-containing protein n=3 Tax=Alphaproteobacteria TaxID=28211 RepID=A0A3G2ULT2_SPHYA|nr:helix-turn-helix domain-containing protein [Sphingobium yanoikuyae]AYO75913.1 MerR family transcriptional regulator [Sphingobium yanoikuyae]KAA9011430.1 helix-turn-helix domain-containing protein [Sphingobium limneticum]KAA9023710.1 helix-turn-helix domain-containing protein [Sphingobium limneticum]QNG49528.1 helix-turn-helix domain-containing protein [Sphingobium yanoikuyae]
MITIGALSKRTGVNIETIRYYERIKLIPPPPRTDSGRRLYGAEDVRRLTFIRNARDLGFDISAIKTMLALQEEPEASCQEVSQIATDQLEAVESRIRRLLGLRTELIRMVQECDNGKVATCRIIEVLGDSPGQSDAP